MKSSHAVRQTDGAKFWPRAGSVESVPVAAVPAAKIEFEFEARHRPRAGVSTGEEDMVGLTELQTDEYLKLDLISIPAEEDWQL